MNTIGYILTYNNTYYTKQFRCIFKNSGALYYV